MYSFIMINGKISTHLHSSRFCVDCYLTRQYNTRMSSQSYITPEEKNTATGKKWLVIRKYYEVILHMNMILKVAVQ